VDLATGDFRAFAKHGVECTALSPDGAEAACTSEGRVITMPVSGGAARPVAGAESGEQVIEWSADGRTLFVRPSLRFPLPLYTVDLRSGARRLWREIQVEDPASVTNVWVVVGSDGRSCVYGIPRATNDIFLVDGLR
jgi:hypothetical protein